MRRIIKGRPRGGWGLPRGDAGLECRQQGAEQEDAWAVLAAIKGSPQLRPPACQPFPVLPQVVTKMEGHLEGALCSSPPLC